jgi:DNA-binding NarL/FixJ family response regulator
MPYELDDRQLQALRMLATGAQRREVARAMGASETTFGRFLTAIYMAMGTHCTIETVAKAMAHGVLVMAPEDFRGGAVS